MSDNKMSHNNGERAPLRFALGCAVSAAGVLLLLLGAVASISGHAGYAWVSAVAGAGATVLGIVMAAGEWGTAE